jgi:hypothetical protein
MRLPKWLKKKVHMKALIIALDYVWNLKILTGYRSKIAQGWFVLASALAAYQEMATSTELIAQGVDMPDIPLWVMVTVLPAVTVWMTAKIKGFVKEHEK